MPSPAPLIILFRGLASTPQRVEARLTWAWLITITRRRIARLRTAHCTRDSFHQPMAATRGAQPLRLRARWPLAGFRQPIPGKWLPTTLQLHSLEGTHTVSLLSP